jgi:fluoride exporter
MRLVAVMVGGAVGTLAHWAVELTVPSVGGFPLATFLINVTGAFLLGLVGVCCCWSGCPQPAPTPLDCDRVAGCLHHLLDHGHGRVGLLDRGQIGLAIGYWMSTLLVGQMAGVYGMWLGRLRLPRRRHEAERRGQAGRAPSKCRSVWFTGL